MFANVEIISLKSSVPERSFIATKAIMTVRLETSLNPDRLKAFQFPAAPLIQMTLV